MKGKARMKKNIMLITQSMTGGGAEKVVANLSIALNEAYNVFIVSYESGEKEYFHKGERININIPGGNVSVFCKIKNVIQRVSTIRRIKREKQIDYAISFLPHTDYANVFSTAKGCKNIIEVSSNSSVAFKSKFQKELRKYVLKKADKIVSVSNGSRKDLIDNFLVQPEKVSTIYNSVDLMQIQNELARTDCKNGISDKKYIVAIGSFRYPKGHWHLIKAFASVEKQLEEYNLVILGEGDYRSKYDELISNLGISRDRIIMPGFVENPYMIIRDSELLVFSSVYEGFGNVIIEAMACGVPVLSVDCDFGPKEILAPSMSPEDFVLEFTEVEYGWMLPAFGKEDIDVTSKIDEKEKEFGKAIVYCLKDEQKRIDFGGKGLKRCQDFSNSEFHNNWKRCLLQNDY